MKTAVLVLACGILGMQIASADEDAHQKAESVAREAMARAEAQKEKNDRVVESQRQAEKAQAEKAKASPTPTETPKK